MSALIVALSLGVLHWILSIITYKKQEVEEVSSLDWEAYLSTSSYFYRLELTRAVRYITVADIIVIAAAIVLDKTVLASAVGIARFLDLGLMVAFANSSARVVYSVFVRMLFTIGPGILLVLLGLFEMVRSSSAR